MVDPWGLVIVLAIGCAYLIWYGLRMGWRLHEAQIEIALEKDRARTWEERYKQQSEKPHIRDTPTPLMAEMHPEDFAADFKAGHVAPDGSIWAEPDLRYTQGLVRVAEGERAKAELFGWEWAGWDGKSQCDLMRHA